MRFVPGVFRRFFELGRADLREAFSPAEGQDSSLNFEAYSRSKTLAFARFCIWVCLLAAAGWLVSDFWVFGHDPTLLRAVVVFRVLLSFVFGLFYAVLRRRDSGIRTLLVGFVALSTFLFGCVGWVDKVYGSVFVFTSYIVPFVSTVFLIPFRQRIATTAAVSAAMLAGYFAFNPAAISSAHGIWLCAFLPFCALGGAMIGHTIYVLNRMNFQQRREIEAHAVHLEELNKAKDAFVATVSHELRTPLNAIIGMTEALQEEELKPRAQSYVGTIHDAGEMLLSLINDILALAKMKAEKLELEAIPFSPLSLVEGSVALVAVACQAKGLELSYEVPPSIPALSGDPMRLQQILVNLLSNAVKFTSAGEIQVAAAYDAARPQLTLTVSDTGVGIPPEKRATIFEEFSQVDASTTRRFGGTGLGLAIVKRLVTLMGGDVVVSENIPRGTRFSVTLPLAPSAESVDAIEKVSLLGKVVVLVVSNALRQRHLQAWVEQLGVHVEVATTLSALPEAVRTVRARGEQVAAALIDDAFLSPEGLRQFKLDVPIVPILDPAAEARDVARYRAVGIESLLRQPLSIADLREFLASLEQGASPAPVVMRPSSQPLQALEAQSRVLVIDDVRENRLVVEAMLRKEPLALTFADSGRRGVELFRTEKFDIVLCDIEMPEMDGYAVVREIRALEQAQGRKPIPVVALTAHGSVEHQLKTHDAGFSGHLIKPLRRRDLTDLLGRSRQSGSVKRLSTSGLNALLPEVRHLLPGYLARQRADVLTARQWVAERNFKLLRKFGHDLKGTGAMYGLEALSSMGAALEEAAEQETLGEAEHVVRQIGEALSAAQAALDGAASAAG